MKKENENEKVLVSIIVTCYNYGHLIHNALDSLIAQTYPCWECIVVDDGSVDDTEQVVLGYAGFDKRIKYIYQRNSGLSSARNAGLNCAIGEYIQFLDADDLLSETKIETQILLFSQKPDIDIVYGDVYLFENGKDHKKYAKKFYLSDYHPSGCCEEIIKAMIEGNFFLVHCPLIKREKIKNLRFEECLHALEDWNFWFKCTLLGCHFLYSDDEKNIVFVRGHENNMSKERYRMWYNKILSREDIMRYTTELQNKGKLSINHNIVNQINRKHIEWLCLEMLRFHLMFGSIFQGLKATIKYALFSKKYCFAAYDSTYWIKERIKLKWYA